MLLSCSLDWCITARAILTFRCNRATTNLQVIAHAACVWDVVFLPSGDLVTACADFASYLWTTDHKRAAAAEDQEVQSACNSSHDAARIVFHRYLLQLCWMSGAFTLLHLLCIISPPCSASSICRNFNGSIRVS